MWKALLLGGSALVLGLAGWLAWDWYDCLPAGLTAKYVGRENCMQCHQTEYQKWQGSHHDLAMAHATDETVLGDFNDTTFEKEGVTSRFYRQDGKFLVHTRGRDGKMEDFELKYTFGVDPLQQYLAEFPDGKLQALPIAWDVHKKRWFDVSEDDNIHPDEPIYWTNRAMNWNFMCAECHSTNLEKNFDPEKGSYHTTWSEIDVSCEACHGPGSIHQQIAANWGIFPDRRYGTGLAPLKSSNSQIQIDTCGKCHARKRTTEPGFLPGDRFVDHFLPELLDSEAYYPDGQIREENYVYTSFHLSLMYEKGVRCTDCHDPHTTKIVAQGNKLCIRCHIPGKYDTPSHHFHKVDSKGSQCVECHMPETTYMKVDPRRDHSFRIPRPELTLKLNIPNACNRCHDDKDAKWAQEQVVKWYGEKKDWPKRIDFAETIAAGRQMQPEAQGELVKLAQDSRLPVILRASALSLLVHYPPQETMAVFERLAADANPLLRQIAVRNFANRLAINPADSPTPAVMINEDRVKLLAERLLDPSPPVRHEAARVLAPLPPSVLSKDEQQALKRELDSYVDLMLYLSDDPAPNMTLGSLYQDLGDDKRAEQFYETALLRDPSFNPARFDLGLFYSLNGDREKAIDMFQQALDWEQKLQSRGFTEPAIVERNRAMLHQAHYSLGLLLAEEPNKLADAIPHFEKAVELQPSRYRAAYNLGLAYQHLGKTAEAEQYLRQAYETNPRDDDMAVALAIFYGQQQKFEVAIQLLRAVFQRNPQRVDAYQMLNQFETLRNR